MDYDTYGSKPPRHGRRPTIFKKLGRHKTQHVHELGSYFGRDPERSSTSSSKSQSKNPMSDPTVETQEKGELNKWSDTPSERPK